MSKNTTKPNTSKKTKKSKKKSEKKFISTKHISLPGGRELKMNITRWIMAMTLLVLLLLVIVTFPKHSIRSHIKRAESKDEIVTYCNDKNLNCTFTELADYDIEGYKVARVAFLPDDFFGTAEAPKETTSGSESTTSTKPKKNVYITVQKGQSVEIPE